MTESSVYIDSMARKATLLIKKGNIQQVAPIIFKIEDLIINHSNNLKHKKLSSALEQVIRFYLIEETTKKYADSFELFLQHFTEYIRTYRDAFEKVLENRSPNNPEFYLHALIYNHLGKYYDSIELHDKAELHFKKAISVISTCQLDDSEFMAVTYCNLGRTYYMQGKESEAELIWYKGYDIQKTNEREYTPVSLQILNYLTVCVAADKADTYLKVADKIRKRIFAPDSPENSESIIAIAEMLGYRGKHSRSITYYNKALQCQRREIPVDHKKIFYTLYCLALRAVSAGYHRAAYRYLAEAQREESLSINKALFILNDEDRLEFLDKTYKYLYLYMNFVDKFMKNNSKAVAAAYNIYLSRKGLLLETQKGFHEAIMNHAPPEAKSIIKKLEKVRSRLASSYHISNNKMQETKDKYIYLEKQRQALENELRRHFEPYELEDKILRANLEDIFDYLPADSALIEFVKIDKYDYEKEMFGSSHYYAFIITKERSSRIILKHIGESTHINSTISELRSSIIDSKTLNDHKSFIKDESKSVKALSQKLYDNVFLPIREHIGKKKRLFICPDDDLNLIPFEILVDSSGRYLIKQYLFNYLPSGRELLRINKTIDCKQKSKNVLMGNPDFGLTLKRSKRKETKMRDYNIYLAPLPNTDLEVQEISYLFQRDETLVYLGKDACEEVLRSLKPPKILHLATHGFFLPMKTQNSSKTGSFIDRDIDNSKKEMISDLGNPLLCSGIALAGFNKAINSNGLNDGVVTAEEILSLNLMRTELVTLSACETGLGKVGVGEGVFGLRSAFARAGATSMVMSLWKVPDKETKDLMVIFYKNMAMVGMNKNEALRKAALAVMKQMKEKHGHTHPRFWGGFIFSGASN